MSSVLFAISGGEVGKSVNTNSDFKEAMSASVTYTSDLQMATNSPLSETRVIISQNEVSNPDFGYLVCAFPSSVDSGSQLTHSKYFSTGLGVTADPKSMGVNPSRGTMGPMPVALPSNEYGVSQVLADNFDRGHTVTSKLEVFPTLIQAGGSDLQGTVWGILANSVPPPSTLNRATLSASVGSDRGEYVLDKVTEGVAAVQIGNRDLAYFTGQSVDPVAQTVRRRKTVSTPSTGTAINFAITNYDEMGLYYYTGNMDCSLNIGLGWDNSTAPNPTVTVTLWADWAYLTPSGQLTYQSVSVGGAQATPNNDTVHAYMSLSGTAVCPTVARTAGNAPTPVFFIGFRVTTVTGGTSEGVRFDFTLDTNVPEGSIGVRNYASYVFIEDYTGPISVTRRCEFSVVPTAENLPLLASSMQRPASEEFNSTLADINHQLTGHSYGFLGTRQKFGEMMTQFMNPDALWNRFAANKSREMNLEPDPQFSASGLHLSKALRGLKSGLHDAASVAQAVGEVAGPMAMMASPLTPSMYRVSASARPAYTASARPSYTASARPSYSASRPLYEGKFYASEVDGLAVPTVAAESAPMMTGPGPAVVGPEVTAEDWDAFVEGLEFDSPDGRGAPSDDAASGTELSMTSSLGSVPDHLRTDVEVAAELSRVMLVLNNILGSPWPTDLVRSALTIPALITSDSPLLQPGTPLLTVVVGLMALGDALVSAVTRKGPFITKLCAYTSHLLGKAHTRVRQEVFDRLPDHPSATQALTACFSVVDTSPWCARFAAMAKVVQFIGPKIVSIPMALHHKAMKAAGLRKRKVVFHAADSSSDSAGARVVPPRRHLASAIRGRSALRAALTSSGIDEAIMDDLCRGDHGALGSLTPHELETLHGLLQRHGVSLATRLTSSEKFDSWEQGDDDGPDEPANITPLQLRRNVFNVGGDEKSVDLNEASDSEDGDGQEDYGDGDYDGEGAFEEPASYDIALGKKLTVRPLIPGPKDVPLFLDTADKTADGRLDANLSATLAEDGLLSVSPSWAYPANPLIGSAVARVTAAGRLKMTGKHGAGNFLLVDKSEVGELPVVHVATIRCSIDPLFRAEYQAVNFKGSKITLHMSTKFNEVGLDRPGNHLNNFVVWAATTGVQTNNLYIDVDSETVIIPDGAIEGPSYTMALVYAALGLPVGPVCTGTLLGDGRFGPVGDMQTKLDAMKLNANMYSQFIIPAFAPVTKHAEIQQVTAGASTALNTGEPFMVASGDWQLQVSACSSPFSLYSLMASGLVRMKTADAVAKAAVAADTQLRHDAAKEAVRAILAMTKDGKKIPKNVAPLAQSFYEYLQTGKAPERKALVARLEIADAEAAAHPSKEFGSPGGTALLSAINKGLSRVNANPSGVQAKKSKSSSSDLTPEIRAAQAAYTEAVKERKQAKTAFDEGLKSFRLISGGPLTKVIEARWPKEKRYSSENKMSLNGVVQGRVVVGAIILDGGKGHKIVQEASVFVPKLFDPVASGPGKGRNPSRAVDWNAAFA